MTIHIWKGRNGDTVTYNCSVKNILRKNIKKKDEIQVEDLSFREFSKLVSQDEMVAFREDINILFYSVKGNARYPMKDERAWRTGIETIY
jgi:hypothetical protein